MCLKNICAAVASAVILLNAPAQALDSGFVPGKVALQKASLQPSVPAIGEMTVGSKMFRSPSKEFVARHIEDLKSVFAAQKVFRVRDAEIKQAMYPPAYKDDANYTPLPDVPWFWSQIAVETAVFTSKELETNICVISGDAISREMSAEYEQELLRRLANPALNEEPRSTTPYFLAKAKAEKMMRERIVISYFGQTHAGNPVVRFYLPQDASSELRDKYRLSCGGR